MVVGLFLCLVFSTRFYVGSKQKQMREVYAKVAAKYDTRPKNGKPNYNPAVDDYRSLIVFCEENTISLLIMNPSGMSEFSYGNVRTLSARLDELIFSRDKTATIIERKDGYTLQTAMDEMNEATYIEMWGFLKNGSSFIARSSYAGLKNSIKVSWGYFSIICIVVFIFAAIGIFIVASRFTEPLRRLALITKRANEGEYEFDFESRFNKYDEIGLLGENVQELSLKLENTISELKSSNLNLQNELKAKTELEEARKKYMSDVSHELKTPIALISGYAEGLKEGISNDPEDQNYYLDVIIDEADKMNQLVKKLATLNKLEQGNSEVTLERFDVIDVIKGFLGTMSIVIDEKQAHVSFDSSKVIYVWSDEFLFEEVLVNYFNNALNHMDENRQIKISADRLGDGNVRISVFNSGEHIAEEEMGKIWGKFYKIDKARTREYGGSGLGLSIVKAIAEQLNRECGVQNVEGGVVFWINLEEAAHSTTNMESLTETQKLSLRKLKVLQGRTHATDHE